MERERRERSKAAQSLSREGAARGGAARAESTDPEERARIARAGAFERHGKKVTVEYTLLEYDHGWHEIKNQRWCRCEYVVRRSDGEEHSGEARVLGLMLESGVRDRTVLLDEVPSWVDSKMLERAAAAYRQHVIHERILPPPGMAGRFISGTLPNAGSFKIRRTYEFAETDAGWEVLGWR
jgi:hypothetical protein